MCSAGSALAKRTTPPDWWRDLQRNEFTIRQRETVAAQEGSDDSAFNESYASAVEEIGVELWLKGRSPQLLKAWYMQRRRESQMLRAMTAARDELAEIYKEPMPAEIKRLQKQVVFEELQQRLLHLQMARGGRVEGTGLARKPLNNAYLAAIRTYRRWVPAFKALWQQVGGEAAAFHRAVEELAALPEAQRERQLEALSAGPGR